MLKFIFFQTLITQETTDDFVLRKKEVSRLLQRVDEVGIRLKRLDLDREFGRVDVLTFLKKQP